MRVRNEHKRLIRSAAVFGVVGPVLLGSVIAALTWLQRDFMRELGWHPLEAPTLDWPSGLALGPYGDVMIATFILCGMMLLPFAAGLHRSIAAPTQWGGPGLLALAGVAMILLAFKADPTLVQRPPTWHGRLHDAAFALLGVSLLPAMLLLARRFQRDSAWRGLTGFTWVVAVLVMPAFVLQGLAFYAFLIAVLVWFVAVGVRLWRVAQETDHS